MPSVATTVARPRFSARLALMAGALAIVLAAATAPTAGAVDSFSATGSMANARSSPAWAVLPNGKVLVAGGFQNVSGTGSVLSSAELYDPQAGTWSTTGSLSTPRAGAAFAQLPDGKLLVAGGQSNVSSTPTTLASAEVYDPATGTFTATTGSMGTSRAGAKAVTMANGKVLVSGGTTNNGGNMMVAATSEIYDPATGNFTVTGTLSPNQISLFTLTLLDDGKVLAAGVGTSPYTSSALYDPSGGAWAASGSMSGGHTNGTNVKLPNGKVLVAGGFEFTGGPSQTTTATAELYDPAAGTFAATGSLTTARTSFGFTRMANGKVLVAGGFTTIPASASNVTGTAEMYDPDTGTFSTVGSMSLARFGAPAILLQDGRVLVPGGDYFSGASRQSTATAEIFSPTTPVGTLSPESADFGSRQVNTGASTAKTFTLSSSGDSPVVIGSAGPSVTGTDAAQFAVSGGTCTAGASVAVGSSCTIEVTFNPTASGAKSASLSVPTNVGDKTATLAGTGVAGGTLKVSSTSYTSNTIRTRVRVSGTGRITQVGTRNTGGASAAKTVTACRASSVTAKRAGTYTVTCKLNSSTRKARRSGPVRVRLTTSFTPTGGTASRATTSVTLRSLKPRYTG